MTDRRLVQIIGELRRGLALVDRAILDLERLAGLRRGRGRPRKTAPPRQP